MKSTKSAEKQQIVPGRKLFAGISGGKTVITRSRQLSGSHFLVLVALKSQEARQFHAQPAIEEMYGMRDLRKRIAGKTFKRTGMAGIRTGQNENVPVNIFPGPDLPDFPGRQNGCPEKGTSLVLQKRKRTPGASETIVTTKRKCVKKKPIF